MGSHWVNHLQLFISDGLKIPDHFAMFQAQMGFKPILELHVLQKLFKSTFRWRWIRRLWLHVLMSNFRTTRVRTNANTDSKGQNVHKNILKLIQIFCAFQRPIKLTRNYSEFKPQFHGVGIQNSL